MNQDFSEIQKMLRRTNKLIQDAMKGPFEQINQAMKGLTDAYVSPMQSAFESFRLSQERLLEISRPDIDLGKQFDEILKPFNEKLTLMPKLTIPSDLLSSLGLESLKASSIKLNRIAKLELPKVEIPALLIPKVEELIKSINIAIPEEHEEIQNQNKTDTNNQEKPFVWTWDILKWILDRIITTILTIYLAQLTAEQLERHHIEKMAELKKQTEISEQYLIANEEIAKQMEDALNIFLESIDDFIPDDPDVPEPDSSPSEDQE